MSPVDIYVDKTKESLPVYYWLLDGGRDFIKLTDSLNNFLKIMKILEENSQYLNAEDLSENNNDLYNQIINSIKTIDNNIEFWNTLIF